MAKKVAKQATKKPVSREARQAEWAAILKEQEGSGLSAAAFAEKKKIGLQSFYQWKKKLSGGNGKPKAAKKAAAKKGGGSGVSGSVVVTLASGISVSIPQGTKETEIGRVISALTRV